MVILSPHARTATTGPTAGDAGRVAERDRQAADLIRASMELKLHGQVPRDLRHVLQRRQERADGGYDPLRW